MQPRSVSPNSHEFQVAADAVETKGDEEVKKPDVDELKDDEKRDDDGVETMECHPVGSEEVVDQEEVDEEEEDEAVAASGLRDPGQPSPAERAEHNLTHIPYRAWCAHCVRGKARGRQSRRLGSEAARSSCPRVRLDYCVIAD